MKFEIETISSVKKKLNIEFPKEHIAQEVEKAYKKIKKTAKIKGFRPNKIPKSVLKRIYSKDIYKNISSQLVQKGISEVINETKIKFIKAKEIKLPSVSTDKNCSFSIEVEVKPEIENINFSGLSLKKKNYEPTKEEVSNQLRMLQKSLSKSIPIKNNRSIKKDDIVTIDYIGEKRDKKIISSNNFNLKVGKAYLGEKFDEFVKGMNVNESKKFTINYPKNFENKKLSGKRIEFNIIVKDIKTEILPDINDEMAKKIGSFSSLQDLKNRILENLAQGYKKRQEQEIYEQIFIQLIKKYKIELPKSMVEYELENILNDTERSFKYHNKSLEDAGLNRNSLSNQYKSVAKKQVKRQLLLEKIIEQESINLSSDELEEGFKEMSLVYNTSIEQIKTFYGQSPEKLKAFKIAILEKKAMDHIVKQNKVKNLELA